MRNSLFLIATLLSCVSTIIATPIVHLNQTTIRGTIVREGDTEAIQFLGIPYAQPPIGDLRFKPTQQLQQYPKTIDATQQPPACPQYTTKPYPWYANTTNQSEDCLYLNIWTPVDASPNNTKPVFFWIHGGSFRLGSIRQGLYDGTKLSGRGDIVVVAVNYRLGPFGFLSSSTEGAPGNAGLWDMLEALHWVQRYIRYFGGDPNLVTIAGESAGSISVPLLSVSPLTRGLFARQIMESGAALSLDKTRDRNLEMTQTLSVLVGCANDSYTVYEHPEEVVKCLKGVDAQSIAHADPLVSNDHRSFRPQMGDEFLPVNPRDVIASGQFQCRHLLIGNTKDEGSAFMTINYPDVFGFFGEKNNLISREEGIKILREYPLSFPDVDALIAHYLPEDLPQSAVRKQVHTVIGDIGVVCPNVYTAENCPGKVYYYSWEHRSRVTPWAKWMGVPHFSELNFLFGGPPGTLLGKAEDMYSRQLQMLWSNFVKYGTPVKQDSSLSPGQQLWPAYTKDFPQYTILPRKTFHYGRGPHTKNCDFLRPYYGF